MDSLEKQKFLKQKMQLDDVKRLCKKWSTDTFSTKMTNLEAINIDIEFVKNGRNLVFTSGWMVRPKGKITNNTPLAD